MEILLQNFDQSAGLLEELGLEKGKYFCIHSVTVLFNIIIIITTSAFITILLITCISFWEYNKYIKQYISF